MSEISYESLPITISYRIYHVQGKWMGICPFLGKSFSGPTPELVKLEIMKEAIERDKLALVASVKPPAKAKNKEALQPSVEAGV